MCFLFAALIIKTEPLHRLIDIQESPLVLTDQELESIMVNGLTSPRRHSLQDDHLDGCNYFEQQFAHHMQPHIDSDCECDWIGGHQHHHHKDDAGIFHVNPFSWLKNKCIKYETIPSHRLKTVLRKTSSENELLLMSQSNNSSLRELPTIRRSFSSGLLFGN